MKKLLLSILLMILFIPLFVNAETCDTDKITISSITNESKSDNVTEIDEATASGKNINLNLSMSEVGDNIEYKIVVKNDSNENYELDENSFNISSDYIKFTLKSDDDTNILKANSSKVVYLKVNYVNEVPDGLLESGTYNDNKTMVLNIAARDTIKNPNTRVQSYILIIFIILLISSSVYVLLKKKNYSKFMILIIGVAIIIPISVYAICKCEIKVESKVVIKKIESPIVCGSFENDSWGDIAYNVKNGTDDCYNVGDTKEVDMGTFGTHTVRIANKSTPSECSNSDFSQTACGFVVEFTDIIAMHRMNPYQEDITLNGNGNIGGWEYSEMRTFVNQEVYNSLPVELINGIIDTKVISGHGKMDSNNHTTIDKLYLLATHEVFEDIDGDINSGIDRFDTSYNNTRQLDYYEMLHITTTNYSESVKQNNDLNDWWWLRSGNPSTSHPFFSMDSLGGWTWYANSDDAHGVSPAFRIG